MKQYVIIIFKLETFSFVSAVVSQIVKRLDEQSVARAVPFIKHKSDDDDENAASLITLAVFTDPH